MAEFSAAKLPSTLVPAPALRPDFEGRASGEVLSIPDHLNDGSDLARQRAFSPGNWSQKSPGGWPEVAVLDRAALRPSRLPPAALRRCIR